MSREHTNPRVWVISELYYPEEAATGHYMTGIAEGLARDYPVHVLCAQPTYHRRGSRAPAREVHNGVRIERCRATAFDKNVFALKLINALSISVSIFFAALLRLRSGDRVLVVTNPPLLPFVVALACRLRGARCILRIDDVYPEAMINAGMISPGGLAARALNGLTRRLYHGVDCIVVLGRDMARVVREKMERGLDRVAVIPNWADLELIAPLPRSQNALLRELGLASRFVVGYAGNIGPLQGVDNLLAVAIRLREEGAHFLFVGSGKSLPWLERTAREAGLTNVTFLGQRPRDEQPNFLNACDVAIVSLVEGMAGVGVPSRMYNIMAAGKPIIAVTEAGSELAMVVEEERIGWVVPPGQLERLVQVILEACAGPQCLAGMGARARQAAEAKYASWRVIGQYASLIRSLDGE